MLTDIQCRTAKPKDKPYKLPDGKGLYLEMKPNGVKAWRYRFELREGGATKESVFAIVSTHMRPVAKWRKTRKRDYANATRRRSPVLQLFPFAGIPVSAHRGQMRGVNDIATAPKSHTSLQYQH